MVADQQNAVTHLLDESAGSGTVISGLLSAYPEKQGVSDEALAETVWMLFQQACRHQHSLSGLAQHMVWLSSSGQVPGE